LVELGFMPEAMSTHPQPYRHNFPNGPIFTGWAYPPKDYQKWGDLVYHFVRHLRDRYGDAEVKTWLWEVWNEPDIAYWQGTPEEYFKLYDYAADAVRRALPEARVGGPDSTGPGRPKAAEFLRQFLQHCDTGINYATGKAGSPLDFISFHPKGAPTWQGDHIQMGIATQLNAIEQGFKIVASFPKWAHTPVILGESDLEGCAACSPAKFPQYGYRNTCLYAAYTAEALTRTLGLADHEHITLAGAVTWAFEFEDQPFFAGFRALATHGVDKPVFNVFRMFGLLASERVEASSSGALTTEQVVHDGVRAQPDVNVVATRKPHGLELLIWNYDDEDVPSAPASISLEISGLPADVQRAILEHFRIDVTHSNSFTAWKEMGSPQNPTPEQYQQLESAGQLQLLTSPRWISLDQGSARLTFELPREGLSLLRISW
jgi:xylan 1,4-beta-xylosidase